MSGESSNEHWIQVRRRRHFFYLYERLFHALLELLLVNADHFAGRFQHHSRRERQTKKEGEQKNIFGFEIINRNRLMVRSAITQRRGGEPASDVILAAN